MEKRSTSLKDVYIVEPRVFGDARGWFAESWSQRAFDELNLPLMHPFVQDNHSFSAARHTLRGLHYQANPAAQGKLVRCTRGAILDVAVDLRRGSPDYLKYAAVTLSAENHLMLWIPRGFAHGFLTLTENAEVQYKADAPYSPGHDRGIRFDDPEIGVPWGVDSPILSDKDRAAPYVKDSGVDFVFEG